MVIELLVLIQILMLGYFCFFGFYNYLYSFASLRKIKLKKVQPSGKKVAVVIVSFNEKEVIADTIKACEKLTYQNKVILVGDDSNDGETYDILKQISAKYNCRQLHTEPYVNHDKTEVFESPGFILFHRKNNEGFKAGNLKEMESYLQAKGFEYMYLLDSDWWPQEDAIERCLEVLEADDKIAYIQAKRVYYHGNQSFLQKCLALNEEGCYYVDLQGRQAINDPILFAGCCTMFRLKHLYAAEGFLPGHLTEDIDLTNRFYLLGFKGVYLGDVVNHGEVPIHYRHFLKQQERWTMGTARTFREYFWPIIKSDKLNVKEKISMMRQNMYFTPPFAILFSILLALVSVLLITSGTDNFFGMQYKYYLQTISLPYTSLLFAALASNFAYYFVGMHFKKSFKEILQVPYATWVSWSAIFTYAWANVKGFLKVKQDWNKTPKTNRKRLKMLTFRSYYLKLANLLLLSLMIYVYWLEWYYLGWTDVYAFFWIPALAVGVIHS